MEHRSDNNRLELGTRFDMKFTDVTYVLGASVSSSVRWGRSFPALYSVVQVRRRDTCRVCDAWGGHGAGEPVCGSTGLVVVMVTSAFQSSDRMSTWVGRFPSSPAVTARWSLGEPSRARDFQVSLSRGMLVSSGEALE